VVGTPYSEPRLMSMEEITGGTPYGATTLVGADGRKSAIMSSRFRAFKAATSHQSRGASNQVLTNRLQRLQQMHDLLQRAFGIGS